MTSNDFQRLLRQAIRDVADQHFPNDPHGPAKVEATPRLREIAVLRARMAARTPPKEEP